jgi:hypothetical protein
MSDPTLTFDLVHVQLGLGELVALAQQGLALLGDGAGLLHKAYCALPFVRGC